MYRFAFFILFFSCHSFSESYYAEFGENTSGIHNSADAACLTLSGLIYPHAYNEPLTGARGPVNETQGSSCATQYSYKSAGNVYWSSEACSEPNESGLCSEPIAICSDGLPANIGSYNSCDREDLKMCSGGSVVIAETGVCSTVCNDFDTCEQYATANFSDSCANSTLFSFNYTDPDNWSYSCTEIDETSPDHIANGGNEDGNQNNDPSSPITPTVSEIDPDGLAAAIDSHLQNDFGNVERAIRDGNNSQKNSNDQLLNELIDLNTSLDNIEQNTASNESYTIPVLSPSPVTFEQANQLFYSEISNSPIALSFSNVSRLISLENSTCPLFEIELAAPISSTVSTTLHCELYETISPILSPVMMAIWIFVGFRIFASA